MSRALPRKPRDGGPAPAGALAPNPGGAPGSGPPIEQVWRVPVPTHTLLVQDAASRRIAFPRLHVGPESNLRRPSSAPGASASLSAAARGRPVSRRCGSPRPSPRLAAGRLSGSARAGSTIWPKRSRSSPCASARSSSAGSGGSSMAGPRASSSSPSRSIAPAPTPTRDASWSGLRSSGPKIRPCACAAPARSCATGTFPRSSPPSTASPPATSRAIRAASGTSAT